MIVAATPDAVAPATATSLNLSGCHVALVGAPSRWRDLSSWLRPVNHAGHHFIGEDGDLRADVARMARRTTPSRATR